MPSTVYKGDLAEVSFGHETGVRLKHNYSGSFTFRHQSTDASANTSVIKITGGTNGTPVGANGYLEFPLGMIIGAKISFDGGTNFGSDDSLATGRIYTVVGHAIDTNMTNITVTPALKTATSTDSSTNDVLIFHAFGLPAIDVNASVPVALDASKASSAEGVLTDQFLGLTSALTLPETKVDLKRYHVVGLGRDIAVQAPGRFTNEGGSFEVNMHNPRWLYYCLGMEAISVGTAGTYDIKDGDEAMLTSDSLELSGVNVAESNFSANTQTEITVDDGSGGASVATTKFVVGDAVFASNAFVGTVSAVTNTLITIAASNAIAVNDDTDLQRAKTRTDAALTAGTSFISYANGGAIPVFKNGAATVAAGDYVIIKDKNTIDVVSHKEATGTNVFGVATDIASKYIDKTEKSEIRRIVAITATGIWLDSPLCFSHDTDLVLRFAKFSTDSADGSPDRASTGALTNGVTRLLYSRSTVPSFAMEVSIRRTDVDGGDDDVVDGGNSDSKQLTRVFRGCKVKDFNLTTDTDAALRLTVNYDAALCYTDTGRLETNPADRYNPHRMFEDTANTKVKRKESGVAVGTQKPYMFYNGQITLGGTTVAQVVSFNLSGSTGVTQYYTINGTNTNDLATDQVPFAGSRNPSLAVEGKTEYSLDMEIIVDDPLFYHKVRRAVGHDASVTEGDQIRLSFTKSGTAAGRETLDIQIDDYVITEAPLQIPEDKGPIRSPLKILPKGIKVISTDTLFHC